jgi:hypothetical protein
MPVISAYFQHSNLPRLRFLSLRQIPSPGQINGAFRVRGINPARDQRGCSPPLDFPFNGARSKLRGIIRFNDISGRSAELTSAASKLAVNCEFTPTTGAKV